MSKKRSDKAKKPDKLRIPIPRTGGPMKDKKKYRRRKKHKRDDDEVLKAPLIEFLIHDQRKLEALGKVFSQFNMSLFDYLKQLRRRGKI